MLCTKSSADLQPGDTVGAGSALSWQEWDWSPIERLGVCWGKEGAPKLCRAPRDLHFPSLAQSPIFRVMERIGQL